MSGGMRSKTCVRCDNKLNQMWKGYAICLPCVDITAPLERPGDVFHRAVGDRIVERLRSAR